MSMRFTMLLDLDVNNPIYPLYVYVKLYYASPSSSHIPSRQHGGIRSTCPRALNPQADAFHTSVNAARRSACATI